MDHRLLELPAARVLVVGDVILDRYWYGAARRISPEAPVPVVQVERAEERVGGAANVAANAAALGAQTRLVGVVGADADGERLADLCAALGIEADLARLDGRPTIVKLRVVSQHQQLVRLDFEPPAPADLGTLVSAAVERHLVHVDVVVVSDYAKGALADTPGIITAARRAGKRVIVDPKGTDFNRYRGATLLTPNLHEFEAVVGPCASEAHIVEKAQAMIAEFELDGLLVTRGEAGMSLMQRDHAPVHLRARSRDVFDVTGAGDTVCAVAAVALAAGCDLRAAVTLANAAAGVVVGKFGAATVTREELDAALVAADGITRGVLERHELMNERAKARRRGEVIVMTNGCFDLLHEGHVRFLEEAKALGNRLLVAVNDDASVRALKGPGRPLNAGASRMRVLAALECVDWVVAFAEPTPQALIAEVLPDILVKGGDYAVDSIAGAAEVRADGGRVMTLAYHEGHSTTQLAARLAAREGDEP